MPETLEDLDGIGERRTERLRAAGYETIEDLRAASPRELAVVEGIGESLSSRIKSQVGTRRPGTAAASTGEPLVAPEDWRITRREAVHLEETAGIDAEELVGETAAGVQDRLELRVDWESLFFRRVCGRVVRPDPETGDLQPVPNATVHVEDTDCSFLGYFPEPWPWGWFFPLRCRREEIATVRTDECGRFCVLVPRWEIDRILRFRRERICLPEIVKPDIRDVLDDLEVLPEPFPRPPGPRPDPVPYDTGEADVTPIPIPGPRASGSGSDLAALDLDEPGAVERVGEVLGTDLAERLQAATVRPNFGESTAPAGELLDRPAFPRSMEPPLPDDVRALPEMESIGETLERLPVEERHLQRLDPDRFVGPFRRCRDVYVPEWVTVLDVPDITFRVTQDVDDDGDEETIYDEGYFDVRWNASPIPDVTLEADGSALSVPTCDGPDVDDEACEGPELLTVGLMPLSSSYHDASTGYALRPNRPRPGGFSDSPRASTGEAPYTGTLQLHGCARFEDAEYYRLLYAYEGADPVPFTGLTWNAPRIGSPPLHVSPDPQGWYRIRDPSDLVFPYWLLNWNTRRYPDGRYDVRLQLGDGSKNVVDESGDVAFVVDNSRPTATFTRLRWRKASESSWTELSSVCPVVRRPPGEPIEIEVSYTVSARHFRDVRADMIGCGGGNPVRATPVDRADYEHWHTGPSDNSYAATEVFELPASLPEGSYSARLFANGRAFNPAGYDAGPGSDWHYDHVYSRSHPRRDISVVRE